jgi:hypothetical protein
MSETERMDEIAATPNHAAPDNDAVWVHGLTGARRRLALDACRIG